MGEIKDKISKVESGNNYKAVNEVKYFIYRHIRLDKNEPFYIGLGKYNYKYNTYNCFYGRAYSKSDRNNLWKKIVNKNLGKYEVEILLEELSYEEAVEKEIEFIKLYGRIHNETGILSNLTDGGEGITGHSFIHTEEHNKKKSIALMGHPVSEETRRKQSLAKKGKPLSEEHKLKLKERPIEHLCKKCMHIETGIEFDSLREGCRHFNYKYGAENRAINRNFTTKKFIFL